MTLDGSIISLEFAPMTKGIRVSKIPRATSSDDIRYKFSNPKIGGGEMTDMMLNKEDGVANVSFEKSSVVSELVKKEHEFKGVPLAVIPYYDDFEERQEITTKPTVISSNYQIDPFVMDYIMNHLRIEEQFDLKKVKFDASSSRFYFTKEFEDCKENAIEFETKLKEFFHLFVKEEMKIPKAVFEQVKEAIEGKRDEFEAEKVDFKFDGFRVIFVGKREDVARNKQLVETMIASFTEEAQKELTDFQIDEKNKLKFFNFIGYFEKVVTGFPEMRIRGIESSSGKLLLVGGTDANIKDVKIKIFEDLMKISEIDVKMSVHQIDFLQRTDCQIVNDELKKDDVMLMLVSIEGVMGTKALHATIFSLAKCGDTKKQRLVDTVFAKTSEKCKKVDEEKSSVLAKSDKLQEFKKEQFDKHQVLIDPELTDPSNIWIVCEESKMNNAEQDLTNFIDKMKIESYTFQPIDPMKVRFLKKHCWDIIKNSCKAKGVIVAVDGEDSLIIKGIQLAGIETMKAFLENLAGNVNSKAYPLNEPGMKKQMSMEATKVIISEIEKTHNCVIVNNMQPEKMSEKTKDPTGCATAVADGGTTVGPSGKSTMNLNYNSIFSVNDKEVKMISGHRITIVVGDLAHQQVDVIVNTTNVSLDLNGNLCGMALLKVAGKGLLKECKKIGSLQVGQVAVTGPAKLECKHVYHVRSSPWHNGDGEPVLRLLIKTCLGQAEKDKLASIAIPAIGTGNLQFPRAEVAKMFFEEVTSYLTAHPRSIINDIRFVAYGGDQATVDAFLGAVQELKSMVLSPTNKTVPLPMPREKDIASSSSLNNVIRSEELEGSLELWFESITVQIAYNDTSKEVTNLIMLVIGQDFLVKGGVEKEAGKLTVHQIDHAISPTVMIDVAALKKSLDTFFDNVSEKNTTRISFSESQSAGLVFDNLCRIAKIKNPSLLSLVCIVIFDRAKFIKFKDATKAYFASRGLSLQPGNSSHAPRMSFTKLIKRDGGISITIYSDDRGKIDEAWEELKRHMNQNIQEMIMTDDVIKEFTDRDLEQLRKLERDFDFEIKIDQQKGDVKFRGHVLDIANVQGKIGEIVNDIKDNRNRNKVPDNWVITVDQKNKFHKFNLSTSSKEYQDVEAEFRKTAPNQIVSIERIQNREIYRLYNVKRQAMVNKYGSNLSGKELMLFHGTSAENIENIHAKGLNRSYAGGHGTAFGRGVYFARDANYSGRQRYSPPDSRGLRYMYYAKVLVGEYTQGNRDMIVAPSKNSGNPNETYDSVVNDVARPSIYVLFQDYEYYTEYLITFK